MIIDMHTHIGDLRSPWNLDRMPIRVEDLIARLDEEGIEKAVVLPWPPCPEAVTFPALFGEAPDIVGQIRLAAARPDRLILFGNADPPLTAVSTPSPATPSGASASSTSSRTG